MIFNYWDLAVFLGAGILLTIFVELLMRWIIYQIIIRYKGGKKE